MPDDFIAPALDLDGFNCPHCRAFAHQGWSDARRGSPSGYFPITPDTRISTCFRCSNSAFWVEGRLIYPPTLIAPPPHDDLSEPPLSAYNEARSIAHLSSREGT